LNKTPKDLRQPPSQNFKKIWRPVIELLTRKKFKVIHKFSTFPQPAKTYFSTLDRHTPLFFIRTRPAVPSQKQLYMRALPVFDSGIRYAF